MTGQRAPLRGRARHLAPTLTIPLLLAGTAAGTGPAAASAAACQASSGAQVWGGPPPPNPGTTNNDLSGVTVLSPCDAWGVGFYQDNGGLDQTLIEHWDGTAWTVVPSPDVAGQSNELNAVRAKSAADVWAVGESFVADTHQTLILHWDGSAWTKVASPNPGGSAYLTAVRAVSATDAWAVGSYFTGGEFQPLTLHWNGQKWAQVASPQPGPVGALYGVAATSASNAWAVGSTGPSGSAKAITRDGTLILHWDGSAWTQVPSPGPGISSDLFAVASSSAGDIWAVGIFNDGTTVRPLAVHCC
jgi:hypothetical protein